MDFGIVRKEVQIRSIKGLLMLVGATVCRSWWGWHQRIKENDVGMWMWGPQSGVHATDNGVVSCFLAVRKLGWNTFRNQEATCYPPESPYY